MRSLVFTAPALFASVSLVVSRPQSTRLRTRDLTDDFGFTLGASPNAFTIPSPSDFLPDQSSPSLIGFPNLSFTAAGTLGAVPQEATEIQDTDYTKTIGLPDDGSFDMASQVVDTGTAEPLFNLKADAIKRSVDSIAKGYFTYGIFGVSNDRKTLVPTMLSNGNDWNAFGQTVRKAKPSYVLHLIIGGILFIFTHEDTSDESNWQGLLLEIYVEDFRKVVEKQCGKRVSAVKVTSDRELQDAINNYSHAAPIELVQ